MNHALFGQIDYSKDDELWTGKAHLPQFARFGDVTDETEEALRREGMLPLSICAASGAEPNLSQLAALQFVRDHEAEVFAAVLRALFDCYQEYTASPLSGLWDRVGSWFGVKPVTTPAELAAHAHFLGVELSLTKKADVAYLLFHVYCDWEPEHGMIIAYHKNVPATWSTPEALELASDA